MTPRRKTSRRRSAANSLAAKRLDDAVFYLDESIHSRFLLERMRECGTRVEHAGAEFPFGTQDEVWLTACGERGWIVLTPDKRIRRRTLERSHPAIRCRSIALTVGEATAAETAGNWPWHAPGRTPS